jgi:hypothetical protein
MKHNSPKLRIGLYHIIFIILNTNSEFITDQPLLNSDSAIIIALNKLVSLLQFKIIIYNHGIDVYSFARDICIEIGLDYTHQ